MRLSSIKWPCKVFRPKVIPVEVPIKVYSFVGDDVELTYETPGRKHFIRLSRDEAMELLESLIDYKEDKK